MVVAHLSDGSMRDVSRLSRFESNQEELLSASEDGLVTAERSGVAAVMVRYQAHVGVFQAIVPTGKQIDSQPEPLNFIDRLVFDQHRRLGITTSADCDDATFIRRATIDIAGRLPTLDEVSEFVDDSDSKKHSQLIDRLLESDDYADYFAGKWAAMLHNRRGSEKDSREPTQAFHQWIREAIRENRPYDQMVRGVLTATGQETKSPPVLWYRMANEPSTQLEDVSQLFLRPANSVCPLPPSPVRKMERDGLLRDGRVLFAGEGRRPAKGQEAENEAAAERLFSSRARPRRNIRKRTSRCPQLRWNPHRSQSTKRPTRESLSSTG